MQIPRRKSEMFKVPDTGPIHLTEEGVNRLRRTLDRLQKSVPELVAEVARTAAFGDRSENAEYQASKSQLRRTYRTIERIKDQLKRAVIIKIAPSASGKIQLGSTIVVEVNGKKQTYQLVGPFETNPTKGRISFQSPLGTALMGRKAGETVTIKTPRGPQEYHIAEAR